MAIPAVFGLAGTELARRQAAVAAARQPGLDGQVASPEERARALSGQRGMVPAGGSRCWSGSRTPLLARVRSEAVNIAPQLAVGRRLG